MQKNSLTSNKIRCVDDRSGAKSIHASALVCCATSVSGGLAQHLRRHHCCGVVEALYQCAVDQHYCILLLLATSSLNMEEYLWVTTN
jgi:hypothetical protein